MTATHDAPQAIDTIYAGHRFRSRLEARWAVFFDVLGVAWDYEPCGYTIGPRNRRRRYLPDFHLPALGLWAEVKGSHLDHELVAAAVHPQSGLPGGDAGLLLLGLMPRQSNDDVPWHELAVSVPRESVRAPGVVGASSPVVAAKQIVQFNKHGLEPVGAPTWFVGVYGRDGRFHRPRGADPWAAAPISVRGLAVGAAEADWAELDWCTDQAYQAAARARFEHGEQRRYALGELR